MRNCAFSSVTEGSGSLLRRYSSQSYGMRHTLSLRDVRFCKQPCDGHLHEFVQTYERYSERQVEGMHTIMQVLLEEAPGFSNVHAGLFNQACVVDLNRRPGVATQIYEQPRVRYAGVVQTIIEGLEEQACRVCSTLHVGVFQQDTWCLKRHVGSNLSCMWASRTRHVGLI